LPWRCGGIRNGDARQRQQQDAKEWLPGHLGKRVHGDLRH
jgi:hypothetical protein